MTTKAITMSASRPMTTAAVVGLTICDDSPVMQSLDRRHVVLLTKPDCGLCVEAEQAVFRAARGLSMSVDTVDITTDPNLQERYGSRVPVLIGVGQKVLAEGQITRYAAQKALLKVRLGLARTRRGG